MQNSDTEVSGNITVFIVITRGFIVRTILRSGTLEYLLKKGAKVVIFIPNMMDKDEPEDLIKEFSSDCVTFEIIGKRKLKKGFHRKAYHLFGFIAQYLVYTRSTFAYSMMGNAVMLKRSNVLAYAERLIFSVLSKIHILKHIARWVEQNVFYEPIYAKYYDKHEPDVVFSTSIISSYDMQFMKEAKKRGIPTVSMPKGWDNVTKLLYRVVPDYFIVQNEDMKRDAIRVQRMSPDCISVCGFPQFDWYRRLNVIMPREEFFKRIGLSSRRCLIFFGSEGVWAPTDNLIAERLAKLLNKKDIFKKDCSLLVRPHYSDVRKKRFDDLLGVQNVKLDDNFHFSSFFMDSWDPTVEETILFANCLYHCDVMIMVASTLALDAAAFDRPSVAVMYGILYDPNSGKDISAELYETDHFRSVLDTRAVDVVRSEDELVSAINVILEHPDHNRDERTEMVSKLCYKIDGKSSERAAEAIIRAAQEHKK